MKLPKTPKGLSSEAGALWRAVVSEFELDPHHLRLLEAACVCWDRIREARKLIDKDGVVTKDRFGQLRQHPATQVELSNKRMLAKLLRELQLDIEPADQGYSRPPRLAKGGRDRRAG